MDLIPDVLNGTRMVVILMLLVQRWIVREHLASGENFSDRLRPLVLRTGMMMSGEHRNAVFRQFIVDVSNFFQGEIGR